MKFRMDQLLFGLSAGLDAVEGEILGATMNHGKRIAILTVAMGEHIGLSNHELVGVAACAILHDNALTEYLNAMQSVSDTQMLNMKLHCIKGEENVSCLPFPCSVEGFIKYHHEFADASGPFHMDGEEIPVGAQLIAIADDLDVRFDFSTLSESSAGDVRSFVKGKCGGYYTRQAAEAMLSVLSGNFFDRLDDDMVDATFREMMPRWVVNKPATELMRLSEIVARITDYKSHFTAKHSTQIANRAYWMARHYQYDAETCAKVYIAAAFHDLGKLMTPTAILEKPGKLTADEYATIQDHVLWSYLLLKDVEGFDEICRWAVTHHRKLDNTGYPELPDEYLTDDFVCRLMACIDIYQAVRETRPYHGSRTHQETMRILYDMAGKGEIDRQITEDLDREMARFTDGDGDVPHPFEQRSGT